MSDAAATTPDGTGVRDDIQVVDLAEGHALALNHLARHAGWHAIDLGTGRGYSVLEIVRAFEAAAVRQVLCRGVARRASHVAVCDDNADQSTQPPHWTACRTLQGICVSTWDFQPAQDG